VAGSHLEVSSQNQMSDGACLEWEVARDPVIETLAVAKVMVSNERSLYLKGCRPHA
jgi:hypothetical protein